MPEAYATKVLDILPHTVILLGALVWLGWYVRGQFSHLGRRFDEHEDVLVGSGLATIEERTDGSRRLVGLTRIQAAQSIEAPNGKHKW